METLNYLYVLLPKVLVLATCVAVCGFYLLYRQVVGTIAGATSIISVWVLLVF